MRTLFSIYTCFILASCHPDSPLGYNASTDSTLTAADSSMILENFDSERTALRRSILLDTAGINNAPVKVLKAVPVKKEYSTYKDISLTYKNVSGKTISAIRFKWHGINSFDEPADMGILGDGFGAGFADERLKPGRSITNEWGATSKDLKKITIAWAYEVAFEDGTKWKSNQK